MKRNRQGRLGSGGPEGGRGYTEKGHQPLPRLAHFITQTECYLRRGAQTNASDNTINIDKGELNSARQRVFANDAGMLTNHKCIEKGSFNSYRANIPFEQVNFVTNPEAVTRDLVRNQDYEFLV